jgi:hypothetical protein
VKAQEVKNVLPYNDKGLIEFNEVFQFDSATKTDLYIRVC